RGGKDLGAFQYKGDVFFVKPAGNDKAEGTSITSAWKTLARASGALQAGQTLYILPGTYAEPLILHGKVAAGGPKTLVRVHGKGVATVQGVEIQGCTALELAHVAVKQAQAAGIRIADSRQVTLLNCACYSGK